MNRLSDSKHSLPAAWQVLLDACHAGLFLLDKDFQIVWVNDYARRLRLRAFQDGEIKSGISFLDLLPAARRNDVRHSLERVKQGEHFSYQAPYESRNGNTEWVQASYSPVQNGNETTHICITLTDVTELKIKEAALFNSEQRWKFALEGAGNGVWEYNFKTEAVYYSAFYKKLLGFEESEFDNEAAEWRQRIHPDDRKRVEMIDQKYLTGKADNHTVEYRLRNKQNTYTWVEDAGMVLERDAEGAPVRLIGTIKDISSGKEAEEQLFLSEQRFLSFMDHSPTMTWIMDENHVYHYMNEVYRKTFNLSDADVGRNMYDIFPKDICDSFARNNKLVWEQDRAMELVEDARSPQGQLLKLQIFKFPLKKENGVRMLGGVALDITEKIMAEQSLAEERERNKRALIQGIIDAQEKERDELAYELHENVNQVLTSAKLMLEVAAEKPDLAQEFVKRSLPYIGEAIRELRNLSHGLRPATLNDISLEAAIVEAVQAANNKGKVRVAYSYKNTGVRRQVPPDVQLVLLRTVQEQLSNIIKFAGAEHAEVNLQLDDELVHWRCRIMAKDLMPPGKNMVLD